MFKKLIFICALFTGFYSTNTAQDCIGPADHTLTLLNKTNFGGSDCLFTVRFCVKKLTKDAKTIDYYVTHTYGTMTRTINVSNLQVGSIICESFTFVGDCNSTASFLAEGKKLNNTVCGVVSDFIILPIRLVSFNAISTRSGHYNLIWQTAVEQNASHFVVQQSIDNRTFRDISKIRAAGNSNTLKDYSFDVELIPSKTNYFRLKMVDLDGRFTYSNITSINQNGRKLTVSPNPAFDFIAVDHIQEADLSKIEITTIHGQKVSCPLNHHQIDISQLIPGVYILKMEDENIKFIKN